MCNYQAELLCFITFNLNGLLDLVWEPENRREQRPRLRAPPARHRSARHISSGERPAPRRRAGRGMSRWVRLVLIRGGGRTTRRPSGRTGLPVNRVRSRDRRSRCDGAAAPRWALRFDWIRWPRRRRCRHASCFHQSEYICCYIRSVSWCHLVCSLKFCTFRYFKVNRPACF